MEPDAGRACLTREAAGCTAGSRVGLARAGWTQAEVRDHDPRRPSPREAHRSRATAAVSGPPLCTSTEEGRAVCRDVRGRLVLRRVPLDRSGQATPVAATVTVKGTRLTATFTPVDAGLPFGPFRWSVRSRWGDDADALPSRGRSRRTPGCWRDPSASAPPRSTHRCRAPTRRCGRSPPRHRRRRC